MPMKCVNCGEIEFTPETEGAYKGYMKCVVCGFFTSNKIKDIPKDNVIMPDPQDDVMCESCQ